MTDRLEIPGKDAALIGVFTDRRTGGERSIYSAELLVQEFVKEGMTESEAEEWVQFNIEGAYVGPHTPAILWGDQVGVPSS